MSDTRPPRSLYATNEDPLWDEPVEPLTAEQLGMTFVLPRSVIDDEVARLAATPICRAAKSARVAILTRMDQKILDMLIHPRRDEQDRTRFDGEV